MRPVLDFIQSQWGVADIERAFPVQQWDTLVDLALKDLLREVQGAFEFPFCMRLVGQSGSGKTTQLLPAVKHLFEERGINAIELSVRKFVKYHPHLDAIRANYGEALLRENTNAFALSLLTRVLPKLLPYRYPIIFEVTLLSPVYEAYVQSLLQAHHYACDYQCLAITQADSDAWIQARCQSTQRRVLIKSSQFFFKTLEPALHFLQTAALNSRCFIWNRYRLEPLVISSKDPDLLVRFEEMRADKCDAAPSLDLLLASKMKFLEEFYRTHPMICD
mgnify:CR=1 FL=1